MACKGTLTTTLSKCEFRSILAAQEPLIIDGALATELEAREYDLNHPLWSAKILEENPEAIEQVHLDYFRAGADIAITASYQASVRGLQEHFKMSEPEALDLIKRSVYLAQQAREKVRKIDLACQKRKLLVAGSVGPYGAYLANGSEYRGDYRLSEKELKDFHRPRLQALMEAGVDILAIETMPSLCEIEAILNLLQAEFPSAAAWISVTLRENDPSCMSDGTAVVDLVSLLRYHTGTVIAVGVNCVSGQLVSKALAHLRAATNGLDMPLLCYPNSGETWDAISKTWLNEREQQTIADQCQDWYEHGAHLIGGCCRTGPKDIEKLAKKLRPP